MLFKNNKLALLSLIVIGFLVYLPALQGPFFFDDQLNIQLNTHIRSLSPVSKFFSSSSIEGAYIDGSNFFRPVKSMTYAFIFKFFGLTPTPFHLVSLLLHCLNAFLIFIFLKRLAFNQGLAFGLAALFCVHPVHTEAVSYISGIADPLGLCFILCGLFGFLSLKPGASIRLVIVTFMAFTLALLSKENMLIFFLLAISMLSYLWPQLSKEEKIYKLSLSGGLTLLALIYLGLKFTIWDFTGNTGLTPQVNIYTDSLLVRINTFSHVIWDYLVLLFYPQHLYLEKPYMAYVDWLDLRGFFGLSFISIYAIGLVQSFKKNKRLFLGLSWILFSLAPVSGIIPLNAMFLEHWLYVPFVGVCIVMGELMLYLKERANSNLLIGLGLICLLLLGSRTFLRNQDWADPIKFYKNELSYTPDSSRVHNNLAMQYANQQDHQNAIKHYFTAIKVSDKHPEAFHNLGISLEALGYDRRAENAYLRALALNSDFIYSYSKLSRLYKRLGEDEKSKLFFQEFKKRLK